MEYLITKITEYFNKQGEEEEKRTKQSFWASETEANAFDIYHKWIGTKVTNPIQAENRMMFQTAKLIEEAYCNIFDELKILDSTQGRIEMKREGIDVTGYMDAVIKEDNLRVPVEIKSYYGPYAEKDLQQGIAKTSHLKQLAIYMDAIDVHKGILLYINRGSGATFQFTVFRDGDKFTCNAQEFELKPIYQKWSELYAKHIEPRVEPTSEYTYKEDIATLDWTKVSKGDISKARNNRKVIGDWQVKYSNYQDLILKQEGSVKGYSDEELLKINELTQGYTTWGKKK